MAPVLKQPDPLQFVAGARTLGDLASRVIDGLVLSFAHDATESVAARAYNESQNDCECA